MTGLEGARCAGLGELFGRPGMPRPQLESVENGVTLWEEIA